MLLIYHLPDIKDARQSYRWLHGFGRASSRANSVKFAYTTVRRPPIMLISSTTSANTSNK
jgi:hypothetical protein